MGFAGGRALLQVEDCPQAAVERLRGEVKDLYRNRNRIQITGIQKTLFIQVDLFCGSGELIACTCHLINNNKYLNLATTNNSDNLATTNNNKNYLNNSNWSGGVSSPGSSLAGAFSSPQSNCHNRRLQVSAPAPPSSLLLASWL